MVIPHDWRPRHLNRYTQYAHRYLFAEAGFRIDRLEWMEGYFGTVAYQLDTAARYLPARPDAITPGLLGYALAPAVGALKVLCALAAILFYRLDIRSPLKDRGFPKNYVVIATKVSSSANRPRASPES